MSKGGGILVYRPPCFIESKLNAKDTMVKKVILPLAIRVVKVGRFEKLSLYGRFIIKSEKVFRNFPESSSTGGPSF